LEAQYNSTSSPPWSPGEVCLRLDAQATYGVRFRRSTYGWKDIFIELASNSTEHMTKQYLSQRESLNQVDIQNLSQCCAASFWAVGPCIVLEPIRGASRWKDLKMARGGVNRLIWNLKQFEHCQ
jgi:hypothetical protein